MGIERNRLSARGVASLREPGRHADGGNLYLNVKASGAKSWVFFYRFEGRQREMGLGSALDVSLSEAREKASHCRAEVRADRDPLAGRMKARTKVMTFGECADAFVEMMTPSWRNEKHAWQVSTTLTSFAASLGPLEVTEIETSHVLDVLKPIWSTKAETASRLRGRIEAVLDYATAKGERTGDNPARWRGHLDKLLPKRQSLSRGHQAALAYVEVPAFMARVRAAEGMSALALEFTILTAARTGETIGATWPEIDLTTGVWTIPAVRMKAGKEHRVPLVGRAVEIVSTLSTTRTDAFVFPGARREKPLSNMSLMMLLRRMKVDVTVHGFRSAFRDWASEETDFPHEVQEMALAHLIKSSVERAYRRGDLFEKRRELMVAWDRYCRSGELQ